MGAPWIVPLLELVDGPDAMYIGQCKRCIRDRKCFFSAVDTDGGIEMDHGMLGYANEADKLLHDNSPIGSSKEADGDADFSQSSSAEC